MELEELKRNWATLNERIEKVEMVNERLVKNMVELRTKSTFGRFFDQQRNILNYGIIYTLFFAIRYLFIYNRGEDINPYILIIVCIPLVIALCKRGAYLPLFTKMDIAKVTPQKALKSLIRYKRLYLLEHYSVYIIGILGTIAFAIWHLIFTYNTYHKYHLKMDIQMTIFVLSIVIIAMSIMLWKGNKFKKEHLKDLKELEDGLQELKEYAE